MKTIKKDNKSTYNSYHKFTEIYQDDFKAGGHSSLAWKMRTSLLDYMTRSIKHSELDILDIGCNNGTMGRELCNSLNRRNINTNIDGTDFVEEATLIARQVNKYRSTYVADITDEQLVKSIFGSKKYQMVFCCEVFLYINPGDYNSFFSTICSLLTSPGYFLFLIPNVKSIYHLTSKAIMPRKFKHFYKYNYDLSLVEALFRNSGFEILSIYGSDLFFNQKINLNNIIKKLFSFEIAILAKKE